MTNQEYLRGTFFGAGLPVPGVRSSARNLPRRMEYKTDDFSFLLKLEEIQRSPTIEDVDNIEFSILESRHPSNREVLQSNVSRAFSLVEFERDMDLLAEGLEHLPIQYRGTYSREDIYLDDE